MLLLLFACTLPHTTRLEALSSSRPMSGSPELGDYVEARDCQNWVFGLISTNSGYSTTDLIRRAEGREGLVAVSIEHRRRSYLLGYTECVTVSGRQVDRIETVAAASEPEPRTIAVKTFPKPDRQARDIPEEEKGINALRDFTGIQLGEDVPEDWILREGIAGVPARFLYGLRARNIKIGVVNGKAGRVDFTVDASPEALAQAVRTQLGPPTDGQFAWVIEELRVSLAGQLVTIRPAE